jgi:hypothetical protein
MPAAAAPELAVTTLNTCQGIGRGAGHCDRGGQQPFCSSRFFVVTGLVRWTWSAPGARRVVEHPLRARGDRACLLGWHRCSALHVASIQGDHGPGHTRAHRQATRGHPGQLSEPERPLLGLRAPCDSRADNARSIPVTAFPAPGCLVTSYGCSCPYRALDRSRDPDPPRVRHEGTRGGRGGEARWRRQVISTAASVDDPSVDDPSVSSVSSDEPESADPWSR